jgi:hypothetical protein
MGFKYFLIDSQAADQTTLTSPYNPRLDIRLDHPIENAINVQMMSFSSPNDYYNVRAQADRFESMLYNFSPSTPFIEKKSYQIPIGLYTITQLVDALNVAAAADPFGTVGSPTLTPQFALLSTNKVSITCSSTGTGIRRYVLYSNKFHNSIAHRIGFSKSQVFTPEFDSRARFDFDTPTGGDSMTLPGNLFTRDSSGGATAVLIDGQPENQWHGALGRPLVWKTDGVGETKTGNNVGFEAYQNLLLKSSLVNQDVESIFKQSDGIVLSKSDPILQKIETNVSLYSYLHWNAGLVQPFVHTLSGKIIQSFSLTLTDDAGVEFGIDEAKHWSAVLRFETVEQNDQVTRENSLRNQDLRFKSSHNCAR